MNSPLSRSAQWFFGWAALSLAAIFASPASSAAPYDWGMNDVSILFPLREPAELLRPETDGAFGPLVPRALYEQVGRLISFEDPSLTFEKLRVVAIRIDPCFPSGPSFRGCRSQIRMVWQPVEKSAAGQTTTADAALHSFYDLPHAEFDRFVATLRKIRTEFGSDLSAHPLAIHPDLARQGMRGEFFRAFRKHLLTQVGARGLTRLTFMKLAGGGTVWDFGGFDVDAKGVAAPFVVPRMTKVRQIFVNGAGVGETDFRSSSMREEPSADLRNVNWITKDSEIVRGRLDEPVILANFTDARWIENPRKVAADQMDCVSCHVAQPAKLWALQNFSQLDLDRRSDSVAYRSKSHSLKNLSRSADLSTNLRGFGYFGVEPAFSARVINESAEVADALNTP